MEILQKTEVRKLKLPIGHLLIIFLTITSSMGLVSAQNNTEDEILIDSEKNKLSADSGTKKVLASEDGHYNISFSDGYNGYCINYMQEEAVTGDEFSVKNTSAAVNNKNGEDIGNYLKTFFYNHYNTAMEDKIKTQHIIWHFSDDFNGWRVDPKLIEEIKDSSKKTYIPDHGAILKINNTTEAVFDFEILSTSEANHQNFFAYKVLFRDILSTITNNTENTTSNENTLENNTKIENNTTEVLFDKNNNSTDNNHTDKKEKESSENNLTENSNDEKKENKSGKNKNILLKHATGNELTLISIIMLLFGCLIVTKYKRL